MASQWYYGAVNAKVGPVSATRLKELKVLGQLQPTDMVWKEGIENGTLAGNIRGLFGSMQAEVVVAAPNGLPVGEPVPITAVEPAQKMIPESLQLKAIPEDQVFAQRAAKALLELRGRPGTVELAPQSSPPRLCATGTEAGEVGATGHNQPEAEAATVTKWRAVALSGAIIISQEGESVHFRKKCIQCGNQDAAKSMMRIRGGINRQLFFCSKCHKQVELSIRGT